MRFSRSERGQALIEFALVLPIILLVVIGLIEFSFIWNSRTSVLFASRDGSMLAAEGGSLDGTDCRVLNRVESDIVSPAKSIQIQQVVVFWADLNGDLVGANKNVFARTGSTTCTYPDGSTLTVPYTLTTAKYPESERCDVLAGCGGSHKTVDIVGVEVTYLHNWLTSFARITGSGVTFTETTITRVEPQL